jgi:hypothetical protein
MLELYNTNDFRIPQRSPFEVTSISRIAFVREAILVCCRSARTKHQDSQQTGDAGDWSSCRFESVGSRAGTRKLWFPLPSVLRVADSFDVDQVMLEILIEELHNHLYLKSFYCDVRWKSYTRGQTSRECAADFLCLLSDNLS